MDKKIHGSLRVHVKSIWNHIFKYIFKCSLHSERSIVNYHVIIKYFKTRLSKFMKFKINIKLKIKSS
jgi:hypothetical protein